MEVILQRIVKEIPMNCEIMFMGDTHIGSYLTHYDGIKQIVDYIGSTKNCFWEHGGDWIEGKTIDHKHFNIETAKEPIPLLQAQEMIKLFKPIRKKAICGLGGNHELTLRKFGNLAKYICDELEIPYGTRTARIIFHNKLKPLFHAFVTHDVPTFRSNAKDNIQAEANIKAAVKQSLYKRMGDCAVMIAHHCHLLLAIPPTPALYLTDTPTGVKQHYLTSDMGKEGQYIDYDRRWYGCAGSTRKRFVDGVDDYSDIYAPNELGALLMYVHDGRIQDIRKFIV
jgi:hypothetical protein